MYVPYPATRALGTCVTVAQASADADQLPGCTCSTTPAGAQASVGTADTSSTKTPTLPTTSPLRYTVPTDAQASNGTNKAPARTYVQVPGGAQASSGTNQKTVHGYHSFPGFQYYQQAL